MCLSFNGSKGRALTGGDEVRLEYWDGRQEEWPGLRGQASGMDRAVGEIVAWLDGQTPFCLRRRRGPARPGKHRGFPRLPRPLGRLDGAAAEGRGP